MLHEGGPFITGIGRGNNDLRLRLPHFAAARFVLFGFRPRRAVHLDRSASSHSDGHASAADRSTCFAHHALNCEPFMQQAGETPNYGMKQKHPLELWACALLLLLCATASAAGPLQTGLVPSLAASQLDEAVEALVGRTKPDGWENNRACLYYALAGQYLLARHGMHTVVRVGAVIYTPDLTAQHGICPHAWLEADGLFIDFSTLPRWGKTTVIPLSRVAGHPAAVQPGVTLALALRRPPDPDLIGYLTSHRARFYNIVNGGR